MTWGCFSKLYLLADWYIYYTRFFFFSHKGLELCRSLSSPASELSFGRADYPTLGTSGDSLAAYPTCTSPTGFGAAPFDHVVITSDDVPTNQ